MNATDRHAAVSSKFSFPSNKRGLLMILVITSLLLIASVFESWRYLRPVTIQAGSHTVRIHKLPDGTVAVLDPASRLALGKEWKKGGIREVWLQGGALFTTGASNDTTGLTVHLPGFDIVAYNNVSVYCFSRNKQMYACLKGGHGAVVTHDAKPKKLAFLPGNVIEYPQVRVMIKKTGQPTSSPAD